MDNVELTHWVQTQLDTLKAPSEWEPNPVQARARFELRQRASLRNWWQQPRLIWAAASLAICIAVAAMPATRAWAQQLWRVLSVRGVDVVRLDFDSLPDEATSLRLQPLNKPAPPQVARDAAEAAQRVGFTPRLPKPFVLSGTPALSTLGPMSFQTVLRTSDLELAIRKVGASDQVVPGDWDGARISLNIGATVTAVWSDVWLMQGQPPVLSTPPQFDLGRFATILFRAVGADRVTAARLGERMRNSPALLLGIGTEEQVEVRNVNLRTGPATLVEDFDDSGKRERVALLWNVPDRVYLLSAPITPEMAVTIANAIE